MEYEGGGKKNTFYTRGGFTWFLSFYFNMQYQMVNTEPCGKFSVEMAW